MSDTRLDTSQGHILVQFAKFLRAQPYEKSYSDAQLDARIKKLAKIKAQTDGITEVQAEPLVRVAETKRVQEQEEKHKQERDKYIASFSQNLNDHGYCFGFSLTRGLFSVMGFTPWWDGIRISVASWNGEYARLDADKFLLPGATEIRTLRQHFELGINFIVPDQGYSHECCDPFFLEGTTQSNILKPIFVQNQLQRLQVMKEGKPLHIQQYTVFAGHFKLEEIVPFLSKNMVKGNICLVSSIIHTLQMDYNQGKPNVYDPEYKEVFFKSFQTTKAAGQEALNRLYRKKPNDPVTFVDPNIQAGVVLIQIATFDRKPNPFAQMEVAYKLMLARDPFALAKNGGLYAIATDAPEYLPKLLKALCKPKKSDGPSMVLDMLKVTFNGKTCLAFLSQSKNAELKELIKYTKQSKEFAATMVEILTAFGITYHWSGFHSLALNTPDILRIILEEVCKGNETQIISLYAPLVIENNAGYLGFEYVAQYAPDCLPLLFAAFRRSESTSQKMALLLLTNNKQGQKALQAVAKYAPALLADAQQFLDDNLLTTEPVFNAVVGQQDSSDKLCKQLVKKGKLFFEQYNPLMWRIIPQAEKSHLWSDTACALLQAFTPKTTQFLHLMVDGNHGYLLRILDGVAKSAQGARSILKALSLQDEHGRSGRMAFKKAPWDVVAGIKKAFAESLKLLSLNEVELILSDLKKLEHDPAQSDYSGLMKRSSRYRIFSTYSSSNTLSKTFIEACEFDLRGRRWAFAPRGIGFNPIA